MLKSIKIFTLTLLMLLSSVAFVYADNSSLGGEKDPIKLVPQLPRPGRTLVAPEIYCYVSQGAIEFELPADVEFAYVTIGDATCPILTDIVYQNDNVVVIPTLVSDCAITLTTDAGAEYYGVIQIY